MSDVKQCDTCGATEADRDEQEWWIKVQSFGSYDYCTKQCAIDGIREFDMSREISEDGVPA